MNESRWLMLLSALLVAAIVMLGVRVVPVVTERVQCSAFRSQADAQRAYRAGATWLDRDGDRLACEARP